MLLCAHLAGTNLRCVSDPQIVPQRRGQFHKPLAVSGRLHPDESRRGQLPIKPLSFSRRMLQLLFLRLPSDCVHPRNLLPTGVVITSNKHHRRLLPAESFGPPTRSLLGYRTEPSLLSNQSLRVDWIRAKAPFGSRVSFWLEDRNSRQEGAFDDAYWM